MCVWKNTCAKNYDIVSTKVWQMGTRGPNRVVICSLVVEKRSAVVSLRAVQTYRRV